MEMCLIVIPFLLLTDILWRGRREQGSFREAFLTASVVFGALLAAATEILGYMQRITTAAVYIFWSLTLLVVLLYWIRRRPLQGKVINLPHWLGQLSGAEKGILFLSVVYVLTTGMIAFIVPPNTWDSMTYHMSRVMHWIQNRTIAHYPTGIGRQLYVNPFAEYVIMHFHLLAGTDRFANFVQWLSYAGSILGVSFIAKLLGSDRRGQVFAMAIAASIPMVILQSTSTQTDLVVAFWGVCSVAFFLQWRATQGPGDWIYLSLSAGLIALTKTTGLFVIAPFGAWAVIIGFRRNKVKFVGPLFVSALIVFLLVMPFLARNYGTYHNPLGAKEVVETTNHLDAGYKTAISSVILNIGLHLGSASETMNRFFEKGIRAIQNGIGVKTDGRFSVRVSTMEDYAGNFRHLVLFGCALLILPWRKNKSPALLIYVAVLILGFVLQCVTLGWSPWRSRYHTIIFVLSAPVIAVAVNQLKFKWLPSVLVILLLLTSAPWVYGNYSKPLFSKKSIFARPRILQYFASGSYYFMPYVQAAELVKSRPVRNIGLITGPDSWEYPFWVLLDPLNNKIRMEHINVDLNVSGAMYPLGSFSPDVILSSTPTTPPLRVMHGGIAYDRVAEYMGVGVYLKDITP